MNPTLTLLLALTAFKANEAPDADKVTQVTPNDVTRFAFDKDSGYQKIQISNEVGPQNDGMLELIDVIAVAPDKIDVSGYDRALIVRLESTRGLDSFVAQNIGDAVEAYMAANKVFEYATAAIDDLTDGKDLHGKWNTILLVRNFKGKWEFKNLRFTSVQRSTDGSYAILSGRKLGKINDGMTLISTLMDSDKILQVLASGYELENGKYHLVRAPITNNGAYAVVGNGFQTVYDNQFKVLASGQNGFTVMPAIDVDGSPKPGRVTTVSGKGSNWDVRRAIPANKADTLASAYAAAI